MDRLLFFVAIRRFEEEEPGCAGSSRENRRY
jgi:hypothetical protein